MKNTKMRPEVLREPRSAKTNASYCSSFVSAPGRSVNRLILFRYIIVNGLGIAGGWADRLALWLPLLDMAAKLLRSLMEARV